MEWAFSSAHSKGQEETDWEMMRSLILTLDSGGDI